MTFKPANFPQLSIYLTVRQCEAAIDFYTQAFSFELKDSVPGEDGKVQHAELRYGESVIMMAPEGAWNNTTHKAPVTLGTIPGSTFYVYVKDVDSFYEKAIKAGAEVMMEPQDSFWGDRFCRLKDKEGYEWMFATYLNRD